MDMDVYGPLLPPKFTQSVQSHASKHSDLESDHHSDPHFEDHLEQPKRVCYKAKKHSDKKKHKVRAKYYSQSSSSEEDHSYFRKYTKMYYKVGQPCFEDKIQELNTDFVKICISPKLSGAPMGKVPLQVLKELEHQTGQNLSTINFTATFAKTASSCNTVMEKCQHNIKATFKKVKSQIQKGANPERAARRGYEHTFDYVEIMNKRILIQQRALACLSKSVAHILQRELYNMGNTGLLRREVAMTLLQPHLGDSRRQGLRNSPFWPSPLFRSQSRMEKTSSLKKAPLMILRVLDPIKTSPFMVPTTIRKEAPTGNAPMGAVPPKAVINRFPQVGGNRTTEALEVIFDPTQGDEGVKTPPPMTPYKPPSVHQ